MRTPHPGSHADSYAHILISSYPHMLISSHPHMLVSSYPHIHISSASASASQPAGQPASQPAGLHWAPSAPLGLQKCRKWKYLVIPLFGHTCPTFLDGFGAPKCKSGAETRFERPRRVSGPQKHQKTSDTYAKVRLVSFWSEKSANGAT